ncbi:hypothetical protein ACOXQA_003489 [Escherichia coli O7:H10]|nr:hypothetical protein [Escherichia coli]EFS6088924.1 hypothetical protein [Salmonella enterica subsp. enterica serovar Johannesburg]EIF6353249.1 hypothetical protein [Salmonella enterica]EFB5279660.1 hypothetical protein [Escherichia coli]EFH4809021.1 hypothetical protein [Escherichia coli]EFN9794908.1 hypothetical protein [Escherichia coli]
MTTFTDKELIKEIKERISSMDVRDNVERRAYEIALASLEADPVAYIFKHPAGKLFWALTDESNKEQADVIPVYAAPPVPVVPAALPENDDEDGHDIDYLEPSEVYSLGRTAGWNACRAAMLYGAVPASQAYKLPQTQFKQVADLYEMQFDDGRTCAFHTDAQKAVQWLQACDGNRVQEYVKLERLQNALSGNSPVTPDGWVMVPKRLTAENGAKGALSGEFSETTFISCLECFGDDDCDTCDGSGRIEIKVPVTWSTIKSIWDKGIEYFAAKPSQEVK